MGKDQRRSGGPGRDRSELFACIAPVNPPPAPPRRGATPSGQFPSQEGYLFSAPTKNSPGARDLSRRNAGKADPRLEISRLLRRPIFLRAKVRAPFARPANTLNTYGSKLPHCSIRWRALHYPEASDLAKRMEY